MENENKVSLNTLIQEKLDGDTEFQSSLEGLEDTEKDQLIADKKSQLIEQEFTAREERATKAEEIAKNQKIRAEKAESGAKTSKVEDTKELTSMDVIAITRANIADDDILEVTEYARFKGISIPEALKDDKLKAILKLNDEKRTVASAANVTTSKRASSKLSDESVLANADRGVFPDDPAELAAARLRKMRSK